MRKILHKKLIHEGKYIAEVDVELIIADDGWSPCLSLEDVQKMDDIRVALRNGDIKSAAQLSQIYTLKPVAVNF